MTFEQKATGKKHTFVFDVWGLDVWGNAKDGFEVNDRSRSGKLEVVAKQIAYNVGTPHEFKSWDISDEAFVKALKAQGYLKKGIHTKSVEIDSPSGFEESGVYINEARTSEPLWQLELPYGTMVPK